MYQQQIKRLELALQVQKDHYVTALEAWNSEIDKRTALFDECEKLKKALANERGVNWALKENGADKAFTRANRKRVQMRDERDAARRRAVELHHFLHVVFQQGARAIDWQALDRDHAKVIGEWLAALPTENA